MFNKPEQEINNLSWLHPTLGLFFHKVVFSVYLIIEAHILICPPLVEGYGSVKQANKNIQGLVL